MFPFPDSTLSSILLTSIVIVLSNISILKSGEGFLDEIIFILSTLAIKNDATLNSDIILKKSAGFFDFLIRCGTSGIESNLSNQTSNKTRYFPLLIMRLIKGCFSLTREKIY